MFTASLILAAVAAGATAVIHGTDAAAADAEPAVDARALQRRWNSVIGVRVALQGVALALLLVTLVAHV